MNETKVAVTPHHEQPRRPPAGRAPVRRHLPVVAIIIAVLALLLVLWYTIDVLVLVFSGILLAVFLRGLSDIVSQYTPLVQERTISMPPALILTAQLVMGVLLGGMGVILATPIVAVMMVLVHTLYVEDTLGDRA